MSYSLAVWAFYHRFRRGHIPDIIYLGPVLRCMICVQSKPPTSGMRRTPLPVFHRVVPSPYG